MKVKPIIIPDRLKEFNFVLLGGDDGKKPIEKGWQNKIHRVSDPVFIKHIKQDKNYGVQSNNSNVVINGKSYFLIIVDCDTKEIFNELIGKLPETFTTTSGSSKQAGHFWFACDNNKPFKIFDEKGDTLADIIGKGNQVVAPGSLHIKSGKRYSVVKDLPIAFISYAELRAILTPYDKSPKKEIKIKTYQPKGTSDNVTERIYDGVSMKKVLEEVGINTARNPTNCFRTSCTLPKCLGWNDEVAHCFDCDGAWNKFSLIREAKRLTDKETFEWFAEKSGLTEELKKARKEYVNVNKNIATPTLPATSRYIKSWGYFNKEEKIHIEQITPELFLYNNAGKKGIAETQTAKNEEGKIKFYYLDIEGKWYILPKRIYDARLFYNIPSINLCKDYLLGKFKPREYKEIAKDIKKILKELFDFSDEVDIEVSNLHIGQSWIKPIRNNFFFYMIDSTLGGGKTTLGEIVYFLVRHGFLGGNISSASIPRLTNELDLNIFIDEIDQNSRDDDVLSILRKGQRRGNPYVRCEGRDNIPMAYDVAGSHGGSFRSELEDAFMNRSLRVHTKKSFDFMLPVVNSAKKEILKPLADELFLWHLDYLVAGCSEQEGVAGISTPTHAEKRAEMYLDLTRHFTKEEQEFLKKVFGRDNELSYLCLETARILKLDVLDNLKKIMNNKALNEASSEGFYLDALKQLIFMELPKISSKTLKDGLNIGYPFYPKNRLYQDFMVYLRNINVQTIGTKKFSSILRDFGFVEGENITSQRYETYPTPCLIFNKKICESLSIPFEPIIIKQNKVEQSQ